jgi:hypothetical protein
MRREAHRGDVKKTTKEDPFFFFFFWTLDFGLSQLTSLQFIHCHVAGFYKLTIPQSPPSHLQDYSICNNARLEFFPQILFQALIQLNGA